MSNFSSESRDRLRVAFCIDNMGIGGTELNAVRTAEGLPKELVDLRVAAWSGKGPLMDRYREADIPVSVFPIGSLKSPEVVRQGVRFLRWLRRERIQVVHAHDGYSNTFAVPWARLAGVPLVVASRRWGVSPSSVRGRVNQWANRVAHIVISNSNCGAGLLGREGLSEGRVAVLPNFVELEAFEILEPELREEGLERMGIPAQARVLGIVANLTPVKDHANLIRAFGVIAGEFRDWYLLCIGEGPQRASIEGLVRQLGLQDRIRFPGQRPSRPNLHGFFDVSTLVSRDEGSPNSLLEAMAAGRPIVATRVGGIPDLVEDNVNGILVPPQDPVSLADALRQLLGNSEACQRMGEAGRKRAEERYSRETVLNQLMGLYVEELGLGLGETLTSEAIL